MKLIVIVAALVVTCFLITHITSSQEQGKVKQEKKAVLNESELTQKQKAHRKFLKTSLGPKLRDLAAHGIGDVLVSVEDPFIISTTAETQRLPTIQTTVCNADAIVVGTLKSESPQLTEDESFLFTEYIMSVSDVIKNNAAADIQSSADITVIREGGIGLINGRTIRAEREGFKLFTVGNQYLLFLRYIPETGAYLAYPYGSFELIQDQILPFGKMPEGSSTNKASFLNAVRATADAGGCVKQH